MLNVECWRFPALVTSSFLSPPSSPDDFALNHFAMPSSFLHSLLLCLSRHFGEFVGGLLLRLPSPRATHSRNPLAPPVHCKDGPPGVD